MKEIKLGRIYFAGQHSGAHVHVRTMGEGPVGDRPLCGHLQMTPEEWDSLVKAAETHAALLKHAGTDGHVYVMSQSDMDALDANVRRLARRFS
ncbi:MAG: hypothetical protein AB7O24_04415 [Kofleriaceae bacterium]